MVRGEPGVSALGVHLDTGDPDGVDTHAGEVVEIVLEAFPITAVVEVSVERIGAATVGNEPGGAVDAHGAGGVVGGIAVGKAVGKDLVDVDVAPILGRGEVDVAGGTGSKAVGGIENQVRVVWQSGGRGGLGEDERKQNEGGEKSEADQGTWQGHGSQGFGEKPSQGIIYHTSEPAKIH